jgi:hypothetical protein
MADFDIVSDITDGTLDSTVSAHENDVSANGPDARTLNEGPSREPAATPKIVDEAAKPDADKPPSLRDTISNALKADADPNATPPAATQDGMVRDPATGQFVAKPAVDPNAAPDPNAAAAAAPVVAAPAGIAPEVFASLPAETQAQLARTMEDVQRNQQRIAWLSPLEQVITPERINAWAMNGGMQPAQAVHQLLALSDFAGRDPAGFIKYMAQQNGVDLETLVLEMEPGEVPDPKIVALERQIADLSGTIQSQTQQQQQAAHERTVNEVIAFADEKGPDGSTLLRPHLSDLGDTWLPHINVVKQQNPSWSHGQVLQQAYENACWANPTVRGKMQAAAEAAAEAKRLADGAKKVDAARTASVSVRTGAPSAPPAAPDSPNRSLRDTIKGAMAQHA